MSSTQRQAIRIEQIRYEKNHSAIEAKRRTIRSGEIAVEREIQDFSDAIRALRYNNEITMLIHSLLNIFLYKGVLCDAERELAKLTGGGGHD